MESRTVSEQTQWIEGIGPDTSVRRGLLVISGLLPHAVIY